MYSSVTIGIKTVPINALREAMSDQRGGWLGSVMSVPEPLGGRPPLASGECVEKVVTVLVPSWEASNRKQHMFFY